MDGAQDPWWLRVIYRRSAANCPAESPRQAQRGHEAGASASTACTESFKRKLPLEGWKGMVGDGRLPPKLLRLIPVPGSDAIQPTVNLGN